MKTINEHMKRKKAQLSLSDAPTVVLLVGLVFLVMATIAFIGQKYGDAFGSTQVADPITNEALTVPGFVASSSECNFGTFVVSSAHNSTGEVTTDFTITNNGQIVNTTEDAGAWTVNYTNTNGGTACQVTQDLNIEIANNTSIAGIVLTISLVGIVLTVLIGIFLVARAPGRA